MYLGHTHTVPQLIFPYGILTYIDPDRKIAGLNKLKTNKSISDFLQSL